MMSTTHLVPPNHPDRRERGSALLLALMVALVLVFLGMGLLLQTSLGLEAAGTDRWVVKALYAADAGVQMQMEMIRHDDLRQPGSFRLVDDAGIPSALDATQGALLQGEFNVAVSGFCETQPATPVFHEVNGVMVASAFPEWQTRHFYFRSDAERAIGGLAGLTHAAVEVDMTAWSFNEEQFVPVRQCY
jgi:Tfp pilus assembly protein PilX